MILDIIKAIVLGIVEGLTEFVPVSSTGHLLLVQRFFGFADEDFGKSQPVIAPTDYSGYWIARWRLPVRRATRGPVGGR